MKFSFDFKFDTFTTDAIQKVIYFDVGDGTRWLSASRVPFDYQSQVWYHVAVVATPTGGEVLRRRISGWLRHLHGHSTLV